MSWQQWKVELSLASKRSRVHPHSQDSSLGSRQRLQPYFGSVTSGTASSASWATHQSHPSSLTPHCGVSELGRDCPHFEPSWRALAASLFSPADERASFCWIAFVLRMVFLRLSQKYAFFVKMRSCISLHLFVLNKIP